MKRIMGVVMCAIVCCLCAAGFGGCAPKQTIDETKTQLYVGVYRGGIGEEWLHELGDRFEKLYENEELEKGKMGVEVVVRPYKDEITGVSLLSRIQSSKEDIYFTQDVDFAQGVAQGKFAEITDVVREEYDTVDLGEGEKTYSIADKIAPHVLNYFTSNEKIYGLPFAAPVYGMMYDVDLFCEKKLYFLADGTIGGSIDDPNDDLSPGPNGIKGGEYAYDDGLPATYGQLLQLFDYMSTRKKTTPLVWAGDQMKYPRVSFSRALMYNYEGYNDAVLNNTFSGMMSDGTTIDDTNAYELMDNKGRLAAAIVANDIVKNKYYYESSFGTSYSNTMAMEDFLKSRATWDRPIGIILEGGYWENEAKDIFDDVVDAVQDPSFSRENRRFSYMPVPKFTGVEGLPDQTNDEQVLVSTLDSLIVVKPNSPQLQLAKDFIRFIHTNDSLSAFNSITGVTRAYKYDMSQADYDAMSYYQKSVYDIVEQSDFNIVQAGYISSKLRKEYSDYFNYWEVNKAKLNRTEYDEVFKAFHDNKALTPQDWYNAYTANYNGTTWANKKLP